MSGGTNFSCLVMLAGKMIESVAKIPVAWVYKSPDMQHVEAALKPSVERCNHKQQGWSQRPDPNYGPTNAWYGAGLGGPKTRKT